MKLVLLVPIVFLCGCLPDDSPPGGSLGSNTALLHDAARYNDIDLARWALNEGFDVNAGQIQDNGHFYNVTPLHDACWVGHTEMARFLLDHGADVNAMITNSKGHPDMRGTPLHHAARSSNYHLVVLLVERGADTNAGGETALNVAVHELGSRDHGGVQAKQRRAQIVQYLRTRTNAKIGSLSGYTDLHWAAMTNDINEVQRLLANGADPNARDVADGESQAFGTTPLHLAASCGYTELTALLLDHGANPDAVTKRHATPLHWAASRSSVAMVELLVQRGADIHAKDVEGKTPLDKARVFTRSRAIRQFLETLSISESDNATAKEH